jgi:hypothetical protein
MSVKKSGGFELERAGPPGLATPLNSTLYGRRMRASRTLRTNPWRIRADLLSVRVLMWVAMASRRGELRSEVHLFLYDRYWKLAEIYERKGNHRKAGRLKKKAEDHWNRSGHDGPPFAAALAMPFPSVRSRTWAVSGRDDPEDAA